MAAVHPPVRIDVRARQWNAATKAWERNPASTGFSPAMRGTSPLDTATRPLTDGAIPTAADPLRSLQDGSISPATLEQLEKLAPGGAERVLKMAELQQAHRIEREREEHTAFIAQRRLGQLTAGAVALAGIVGAVMAVRLSDSAVVAVALAIVALYATVQALRSALRE